MLRQYSKFAVLMLLMSAYFSGTLARCQQDVGGVESSNDALPFTDSFNTIANRITSFNAKYPQEKVYLHIDNSHYHKGEDIRYHAYVIRDDNLGMSNISNVLYVELTNRYGDVVSKLYEIFDEFDINDIHTSNIGFIAEDEPIIIDYSGFY